MGEVLGPSDLATKEWLRSIFPSEWTREEMAEELGVTRRTLVNLLSSRAGFGNGLTMLRYLQLAGAVTAAPEENLPNARLAELEAAVKEGFEKLQTAVDKVEAAIVGLANQRTPEGQQKRRRRGEA